MLITTGEYFVKLWNTTKGEMMTIGKGMVFAAFLFGVMSCLCLVWARESFARPTAIERPAYLTLRGLNIVDERGKTRARLGLGIDGATELTLTSPDGKGSINLTSGGLKGLANYISIFDKSGEERIRISVLEDFTSIEYKDGAKDFRTLKVK